jgi:predicted AlkP superfamily phosphohydrolase/phosphomutase
LEKADDKTVVMVMSDHGFTHFKRGVNLNSWLFQNGYLKLKGDRSISGDWFDGVDWEGTRAFSLGLTGIFINRKGRESCGIVAEGEELRDLKRELIAKLRGLVDDGTNNIAIRDVVDTESAFSGPYTYDAVDLLIGYNAGYRSSWASATGRVTDTVFDDNTKHWSGDHSVHPDIVPGVFFTNRKINTATPNIKDISATVLKLFGVEVPSHMKGRPLMDEPEAVTAQKESST